MHSQQTSPRLLVMQLIGRNSYMFFNVSSKEKYTMYLRHLQANVDGGQCSLHRHLTLKGTSRGLNGYFLCWGIGVLGCWNKETNVVKSDPDLWPMTLTFQVDLDTIQIHHPAHSYDLRLDGSTVRVHVLGCWGVGVLKQRNKHGEK